MEKSACYQMADISERFTESSKAPCISMAEKLTEKFLRKIRTTHRQCSVHAPKRRFIWRVVYKSLSTQANSRQNKVIVQIVRKC